MLEIKVKSFFKKLLQSDTPASKEKAEKPPTPAPDSNERPKDNPKKPLKRKP
jgi:hypothetical protein